MTEEIIINGVNVAGCNFRLERDNKQKCECCHATGFGVICDCEAWHNCYYKQLQGIKQQNLELIERANAYPKIVILANERLNEIARLEQENKEIYENGQIEITKLCNEKTKYRSALEEIREKIKSLNKDICNNCGWYNTDNCQPNGYVCHDLIEIKNKINEVLE